jgi:hypothetical protein
MARGHSYCGGRCPPAQAFLHSHSCAARVVVVFFQIDVGKLPLDTVDGEEVLHFYWLDAFEAPKGNGTVYLFGKVGQIANPKAMATRQHTLSLAFRGHRGVR